MAPQTMKLTVGADSIKVFARALERELPWRENSLKQHRGYLSRPGGPYDYPRIEEHRHLKVTETVGRLVLFVESHLVPWEQVYVDAIGVGAGVRSRADGWSP